MDAEHQVCDELLMAQVAQGKRERLEPLLRRYAHPLLTFIQRMVGSRHRAEELFQEVFLAVWHKRAQYQFPRPFKSWLFAIAVNKCREAGRSRRPTPLSLVHAEDRALADDPSPEDRLIATETAVLVTAAVQQLPPQQRAVVVLRIWQNLPYDEIAQIVGRTEATVRSHMHHGLAGLRKYLEPRMA
ncbi:MAG: sigma-70 family RNA polymerase sigma factor [Planctomycetia bacterium]|nr:sigma-70 family RNA polymerase sigma factor [Planctomycetia bacterium]